MVEVKVKKGIKIKKPLVLIGFYSPGLIGTLVSQYMAKKDDSEQIGHIESGLPPVAMISKGKVEHPIRIYRMKKKNMIIIASELPIPPKNSGPIAKSIVNWVKKINGEIVCVEGMLSKKANDIFMITSKKKLKTDMEKMGEGIIMGITGAILLDSLDNKIDTTCIIAQTDSLMPNGRVSAEVINRMNNLFDMDIDVKPLIKETEKFEKKMKKMPKLSHSDHQKVSRIYG